MLDGLRMQTQRVIKSRLTSVSKSVVTWLAYVGNLSRSACSRHRYSLSIQFMNCWGLTVPKSSTPSVIVSKNSSHDGGNDAAMIDLKKESDISNCLPPKSKLIRLRHCFSFLRCSTMLSPSFAVLPRSLRHCVNTLLGPWDPCTPSRFFHISRALSYPRICTCSRGVTFQEIRTRAKLSLHDQFCTPSRSVAGSEHRIVPLTYPSTPQHRNSVIMCARQAAQFVSSNLRESSPKSLDFMRSLKKKFCFCFMPASDSESEWANASSSRVLEVASVLWRLAGRGHGRVAMLSEDKGLDYRERPTSADSFGL